MINSRAPQIHKAVCNISQKSEKLPKSVMNKVYVDTGHLIRLSNPSNQYIDGRRGTGKTHLLTYLTEEINSNFHENNKLAIFIDTRECRAESAPFSGSPQTKARMLFKEMAKAIAKELRTLTQSILFLNELPIERSPWEMHRYRKSQELLDKLHRTIEEGYPITPYSTGTTKETKETSKSIEGGMGLSTTQSSPEIGIFGKFFGKQSQNDKSTLESSTIYTLPYNLIRATIEEYMETNSISQIYLIIDEWSDIPLDTQPFVAESLKRTFFPSDKISTKIGCIPYSTSFQTQQNKTTIGLEPNGDIYKCFDLDDELVYARNPNKTSKIFSQMLQNHIDYHTDQDSIKINTRNLFTAPAYERILKFSHGNPRDFLSLFIKSYFKFHTTNTKQITSDHVNEAAKELGSERIESIKENLAATKLINEIIKHILQEHQLGAALISSQNTNSRTFQFLLHHRLLHVWDRSYSSPSHKGDRFSVISLDYCIIVDQLKSPNYRYIFQMTLPFIKELFESTTQNNQTNLTPEQQEDFMKLKTPDKRKIRNCVLPDNMFQEAGEVKLCQSCSSEYRVDHPVYIRHNMCPNCGEHINSSYAG